MMKRKRGYHGLTQPAHWTIATEYRVGRKVLAPGTVFAVSDEPGGRFKFIRHVTNTVTDAEWVDCVGGTGQGINAVIMLRAFRPQRITRVFK